MTEACPSAFVLLAASRTGSTLLGNALADHPSALYYGEIFHRDLHRREMEASRKSAGAGVIRNLPHGVAACADDEDGFGYLSDLYAPRVAADAVGFKLLYHHARSGPMSTAWRFVQSRPGLKIVHLRRPDWLATLISYERANRSGRWHALVPITIQPFAVSPARCQQWFEEQEAHQQWIVPLIASQSVMDVSYEEFVSNFAETVSRVYRTLGLLAIHPPPPRLAKLATMRLSTEIQNYGELKQFFRDSRFERFFIESPPG